MTATVSINGGGEMPDYWADEAFNADLAHYLHGHGELWSRIAEGKRRDG